MHRRPQAPPGAVRRLPSVREETDSDCHRNALLCLVRRHSRRSPINNVRIVSRHVRLVNGYCAITIDSHSDSDLIGAGEVSAVVQEVRPAAASEGLIRGQKRWQIRDGAVTIVQR